MGVKLSSLPRKVWNEPGTLKLVGFANAMNLREVRWWERGWGVRGVHLCHPFLRANFCSGEGPKQ